MQAAVCLPPTTPTRSAYSSPTNYSHPPLRSSPLASPASSPAARAEARRRSHYKANPFSTPASHRSRDTHAQESRRRSSYTPSIFVQGSSTQGASSSAPTEEPPRKTFLRERLKARCLERAAQKRERALARGSRHLSSDRSSDGIDEMMEDDEEEEVMLNDELFRRIVDSAKRKERHAYRLSYAYDVGSSFDPDMEDPQSWETELNGSKPYSTEPDDLLEEELEAYAAEAELNLDDLQVEDIWSLSDYEDFGPTTQDDMDTD
ncbi:hypothetical protein BD309DRAFT_1002264 [Dichomitus squalens]|uniref:Uncharacterized protein n=1 Tax=Dichomitus squalens TaxID=114155 RepID=A0A4Q9NKC0_9APHY|nr:uncharacterized protein DICSQDRAFT_145236 [Dichomitus squalens LYAD-421 SS1]EJF63758.1 hypothetical protein DICSQDRAFT_145236 [Dichomitus squalens LYAD-421 SS1]TBU41714.1 hypothetical protein BD309DRAFT_1002264 [Dichomitus squalens]TBU59338.1 hypothetical protein BD310DRAFT_849602 [Dichomitus squalens]